MSQGFAKAEFADPGWQDYVPSYTNITVGNGTVVARYIQIGTSVTLHYTLTFGSTTSIDGSNPKISIPVTASSEYTDSRNSVGTLYMLDSGTKDYPGTIKLSSTTQIIFSEWTDNGTNTEINSVSATSPFTWATSDIISFTATYEAAASLLIGMGQNNDHGSLSGLTDWDHGGATGRITIGTIQSIPNASTTVVKYDNLSFEDDDGGHISFDLSTGVITIATAGTYLVTAAVTFASNVTGFRLFQIRKNTSAMVGLRTIALTTSMELTCSTIDQFSPGNTIDAVVHQTSGGNLDITVGSLRHLAIARLA